MSDLPAAALPRVLALKVDWKYIQYLLFNVSAHCLCDCRGSFRMAGY